jgi:hypothetical protein
VDLISFFHLSPHSILSFGFVENRPGRLLNDPMQAAFFKVKEASSQASSRFSATAAFLL